MSAVSTLAFEYYQILEFLANNTQNSVPLTRQQAPLDILYVDDEAHEIHHLVDQALQIRYTYRSSMRRQPTAERPDKTWIRW
jgi:hypothetical protein